MVATQSILHVQRTFLLGLCLVTGCTVMIGDDVSNVGISAGKGQESTACKIEGSQIGREGLVMRLGDRTVTFHDWVDKTGSNGEYVGFSISITGAASLATS